MLTSFLASLAVAVASGSVSAWAAAGADQPPVGRSSAGKRPLDAAPHVRASIAPQVLRTPDGRRFIEVDFAIEDGWHLYWRNPGDSGQPPRIDFTLPEGWTAGEPLFPVPNHLPPDEDILAFESSLRLLVPIIVPSTWTWTGQPVTVSAKAQWMTCKESCVVERQSITAMLGQREGAMPAGYPEPAPSTIRTTIRGNGEDAVLVIDATALGGTARWFPDACPGIRFPSERMQPMPGGRIEIPVVVRPGDAPDRKPVARGMVVIESAGELKVHDLAVPVVPSTAK